MKISLIVIFSILLTGCGTTPPIVTKTKLKYVDRVVLKDKLICCNCTAIQSCPLEGKIETNGDLLKEYICLLDNVKIENILKSECSLIENQ